VWATSEFQLGEGGLEVFDDLGGDDVGIGEMIRTIIDISHWEDPIDFKKVAAAGIVAVIAKATQGAARIDSAYAKFRS
jgi:glycosyl hydrolase family 25